MIHQTDKKVKNLHQVGPTLLEPPIDPHGYTPCHTQSKSAQENRISTIYPLCYKSFLSVAHNVLCPSSATVHSTVAIIIIDDR